MPSQYPIPVRTGQAVKKRVQNRGEQKEGPLGKVVWSTLFKGHQSNASQAISPLSSNSHHNVREASRIWSLHSQDMDGQLPILHPTQRRDRDARPASPVHVDLQKPDRQHPKSGYPNLQLTNAQLINIQPTDPQYLPVQLTTPSSTKSESKTITASPRNPLLPSAKDQLLRCHRRFFNQIEGIDRASIPPLAHAGLANELKRVLNSTGTMPTEQKLEVRHWAFKQQIAETMSQVKDAREQEGILWSQLRAVLLFGERDQGEAMWCKEGFDQLRSAIQQRNVQQKA